MGGCESRRCCWRVGVRVGRGGNRCGVLPRTIRFRQYVATPLFLGRLWGFGRGWIADTEVGAVDAVAVIDGQRRGRMGRALAWLAFGFATWLAHGAMAAPPGWPLRARTCWRLYGFAQAGGCDVGSGRLGVRHSDDRCLQVHASPARENGRAGVGAVWAIAEVQEPGNDAGMFGR